MRLTRVAATIAGLSLSTATFAAGPMMITGAWSRVTPSAESAAVVYLTATDMGSPDTLLSVATPVAKSAELHQSKMAHGMMEMDAVGNLPVAAGNPLAFSPGGYHIMLTGLAHALNAGDHFPITLNFAHAGAVTAEVTVQPMSYTPPGADMGGMKM